MSNRYLDLFVSLLGKRRPKRLVRFSEKWVDSDLPFPRSSNTFFAHITESEIQLLFGISNFLTDDVKALSILSLSPQKVLELRDFISSVLDQYSSKFGSVSVGKGGPSNSPPPSPSVVH